MTGPSAASSASPAAVASTANADTYVVQPHDSLSSIAKKPDIYGTATQWRRLFEANRELLNGDPNRLQTGMTLQIPRGAATEHAADSGDEGMTFKK